MMRRIGWMRMVQWARLVKGHGGWLDFFSVHDPFSIEALFYDIPHLFPRQFMLRSVFLAAMIHSSFKCFD